MNSREAPLRPGCVVAALAVIVLTGCSSAAEPPPAPQPPEVSVVTVQRGSVPVTTELPGRTSAYLVAQVRARVDGIVLTREFTEGADVKANQRLYQIDPAPYRATLDSALGTLQKAQASVVAMNSQAERYKILVDGNGVTRQEYDNAIAAQGQAVADVALGQAAVQHRANQSRLHRCPFPHHRPHWLFRSDPGCVCAGERRDPHGDGSADRSYLC